MFRSTTSADLGAVLSFSLRQNGANDPAGAAQWVDALRYLEGHDTGNYRDEWTWLALLDDRPIARAIWWGQPGAPHPTRLDCLLVEPTVPHPEVWSGALVRSALTVFMAAGAVDSEALRSTADDSGRAAAGPDDVPHPRQRGLTRLRR